MLFKFKGPSGRPWRTTYANSGWAHCFTAFRPYKTAQFPQVCSREKKNKKNVTRTSNRRPRQSIIIFKKANSEAVESLPPAATGTRPYMLRKVVNQLVVIKKGPPTKRRGVMVADQPTNFTYFYLLYINSIQPVSRLFSLLPLIQRIEACLHWASRILKRVLVLL